MQEFNPNALADVLATHHNVNVEAIKKTQAQKEAEVQAETQQQVADKAIGPAVTAAGQAVNQSAPE